MSIYDENWNFSVELFNHENKYFDDFYRKVQSINENVLRLLDRHLFNKINDNDYNALSSDLDLKSLTLKNKELKEEIDAIVEQINQHETQRQTLKEDRKILSQEIKDTHEAFLMAKKYYKKYLKLYYTIEGLDNNKQKVSLQFFTDTRKSSSDYSVNLLRDMKFGTYELVDTIPKLNNFNSIQRKLQETGDVPAILCTIRQSFLKIKESQ